MDVIIVCHTEFGLVRNKKVVGDKRAVSGVRDGVFNLVKIAEKYGTKVSFAVCPEVVEYFPKNIKNEIGLHIHPGWQEFEAEGIKFNVGDKYLRENCKQSSNSTVLWDYSYDEQFNMIKIGKEYIKKNLGADSKFFVAGRWCVNNDTVRALMANDFTHDCSATPHAKPSHHNWSKLSRICMPYHPNEDDYQREGDLPLLIVPISKYFRNGGVNPEMANIIGISWLKACFSEYYRQGAHLFHICLHSPSMADDYFISVMDSLLSFISKHKDVSFKFASEIREYPHKNIHGSITPYLFADSKYVLRNIFRKYLFNNK